MEKKDLIEKLEQLKKDYERINEQKQTMIKSINNYNERIAQISGAIIVINELLEKEEQLEKKSDIKGENGEISNNKGKSD